MTALMLLLLTLLGVLGLAVGSFLNVVIWRVPRGLSVIRPRSACPACGHPVRARDNIPVVSWLILRGRCRDCAAPIDVRYPLVEVSTAVLFALAGAWALLGGGPVAVLPALLYLVSIAVALTVIDIDTRRLPNAIVLPSYPVLAVLLTAASALTGQWPDLARAAAGLAILGGFYLTIRVIYPRGMGFGDVKLAGLLGLVLGWFGWGALMCVEICAPFCLHIVCSVASRQYCSVFATRLYGFCAPVMLLHTPTVSSSNAAEENKRKCGAVYSASPLAVASCLPFLEKNTQLLLYEASHRCAAI